MLLLSCDTGRLWDATLAIKATRGDKMLHTGGEKEEKKYRLKNRGKPEGHIFNTPKYNPDTFFMKRRLEAYYSDMNKKQTSTNRKSVLRT